MNKIYNTFFELIRVAIGTQDTLSRPLSEKEWAQVYDLAKKQSIIGICFAGLRRMGANASKGFESIGISKKLYITWMSVAAKIQGRNEVMNKLCARLEEKLTADGYQSCVLKGQGVASLYKVSPTLSKDSASGTYGEGGNGTRPRHEAPALIDLSLLRQSGDIDTWMVAKPKTVIEWARRTGKMYYYDYHHADLEIFPETEVELHYRPSLSRNLVRDGKLQKWFRKEGGKHIVPNKELGFSMPDYEFNILLTMNHNFFHLLYEGVGMRQFLDLFFILKSCTDDAQRAKAWKLLRYMHLKRFTRASMWLMKEVFGLDDKYLVCEPDAEAGKFLLKEIMKAGNFGKYDKRLEDGRYSGSRVGLMITWVRHTFRLFKFYPSDVLWTPIGILRISLWRRWHYRKEDELKNL